MSKKLPDEHLNIYNKQEIKKKNVMQTLIDMFRYASRGIYIAFKEERNMRIHTIIGMIVLVCGVVFKITLMEWLIVIICITLILVVEMINTAIENIVDFISPEYHQLAGKIKDISSGAVMLTSFGVAIVGIVIFLSKIL